MYGVWQEFEPASSWMQVRRPATNVTNFFFHFRICIPRTSHIKVFFSAYCHAALNFGWRAALPSVSFCSPTPPSVRTGSFQPSPNEFKLHYIKHGATRPMSIQECRGVGWHHTTGRSPLIPIGVKVKVKAVCGSYSTSTLWHIVLLPERIPSFISRGAAHAKRRERPLVVKEGTIHGI
jgi:hypothetical protein